MPNNRTLFKKKIQTQTPGVDVSSVMTPQEDEDLLHWSVRTLFDQLFKVSVDEVTLPQVQAAFSVVADQIKVLPPANREVLLKSMDFFVGRVRAHIEPVLLEWHRANK